MTLAYPPLAADPEAPVPEAHARAISRELDWLDEVITARLEAHFGPGTEARVPLEQPPEVLAESALGALIAQGRLDGPARAILALALTPEARPAALDPFFLRNAATERTFTEFGGQIPGQTGGFLPTGETALFLLAGTDPVARGRSLDLLSPDHPLRRLRLVKLDAPPAGGPALSGLLRVTPATRELLLTGRAARPDQTAGFPAHRLTTRLAWDDLVLSAEVMDQVEHIAAWVVHERRILDAWGLGRALKPGYRALFHGPPGTGKTLTATLLGQRAGVDVYRVDLSMIVSKYIGETEKNLARVFDRAAEENWILFFDEADALFGARTATTSSNDRHANQEVAYLLQRVEDCPCLVILATNLRGNIDDAFSRRFQSVVGFTRPTRAERERLWDGVFGTALPLDGDVSAAELARDHDFAGGAILNVVRHAAVSALRRGADRISRADLRAGIVSEAHKEGRMP